MMRPKTAERLLRRLFPAGPPIAAVQVQEAFFDISRLRQAYIAQGLCGESCDEEILIELYFARVDARLVSPNAIFDEIWYRMNNPDVATAIKRGTLACGFVHFVNFGIHEGRWPNAELQNGTENAPTMDAVDAIDDSYLAASADARRFLKAFPWVDALHHYNQYGRKLGYAPNCRRAASYGTGVHAMMAAEFDAEFYRETYLADVKKKPPKPFEHYLVEGSARQYSPNKWFQEDWYRAFYADVRDSIASGAIPSGFYHYILHGRRENRLPSFELKTALEAKLPGVTKPVLLESLPHLREKMALPETSPEISADPQGRATIWFILPILNPDMSFGGYQAAYALMCAVVRAGFALGIICTEEAQPNRDYFIWRQKDPELRAAIAGSRLHGPESMAALKISRRDHFIAYSVWGLTLATFLAREAGSRKPFLLAQEYEPIFYGNNATRALCAELYNLPHHAIINSHFLHRFLLANRIGPFASPTPAFTVFEHLINVAARQPPEAMRGRTTRVLAAYARPEAHAERNLFELVLLALEQCCGEGLFGPEWMFIGLGALSDLPDLRLGGGHVLQLKKKLDAQEYAAFMSTLDIGICVIDAPHPGVMPFEFAATGALVVTNIYANRTAQDLTKICRNFVPCEPRVAGLAAAIREAVSRVEDFEARAAQAYAPATAAWSEIFSPDVVQRLFGHAKPVLSIKVDNPQPMPRRYAAPPKARRVGGMRPAE